MKKVSTFDCGPAFAMTKVILYAYNKEDKKSVTKMKKFRDLYGKPGMKNTSTPSGCCLFEDWRQTKARRPIYVVLNIVREIPLNAIFRTLPHELSHISGFLSDNFHVDPILEPIAYTMGYMTEQFQKDLLRELGYEITRKEESK